MMNRKTRASACIIAMALTVAGFDPIAGCGSSSPPGGATGGTGNQLGGGSNGGSGASSGNTYSDNDSGGFSTTSSSGGFSDDATVASDDGGDSATGSPDSSGSDANSTTSSGEGGEDAPTTVATMPEAAPSCTKGLIPANQVVMIGDSYLDPAYSNAALDLYANAQMAGSLPANTTYRHYYQGGAAMNNGSLQFNIPYQYENQALTDLTVMNPATIDTIIMDGGGNDVLIDDQSCLTSAPPGNTGCVTEIQGVVTRATSLLQEMASKGVKHIVYFFYPHLDPAGGGLLPTPSPDVNVTLDYAYPLAEQLCCGTTFTSTATSYTCSGNTSGTQCIFIDTRPAFEGHVADYIKTTDHVHPTPAGAQVIANLIWQTMMDNCIAQ